MRLDDIDIYEIGNTIGLVGAVFGDEHNTYLCMFPDQEVMALQVMDLNKEDWVKLLRQTDLLETEVLAFTEEGKLSKAIVRKTQRHIEQRLSWAVYKRDNYTCRYCGRDDVPLTVDHLVLWEEGGPSIEGNLVAACRKCNKTRGRMQYAEWLGCAYYQKKSQNVSETVKAENICLIATLDRIPRNHNQRSRK